MRGRAKSQRAGNDLPGADRFEGPQAPRGYRAPAEQPPEGGRSAAEPAGQAEKSLAVSLPTLLTLRPGRPAPGPFRGQHPWVLHPEDPPEASGVQPTIKSSDKPC